uniref:Leucine-rich repeat protein SHOC-2 n=1 Tax=Chrysemys picta bellii TaxID=8478 RepID=A0A8C3PDI5_CHRPI
AAAVASNPLPHCCCPTPNSSLWGREGGSEGLERGGCGVEGEGVLTLFSDPRVESLNLDRNKLKHVPGISKLGNLRKLILSKNEIADFPEEIQSLVHLEKLELNQNQIRVIPEGIFSYLPRLKHLRLNNNRLSALPKDLATCSSSLQYLNMSNNLFRAVPQSVLEPLKMFKAHGNPLREPPSEVCAQSLILILATLLGGREVLLSPFYRWGTERQRNDMTCPRSQRKLWQSWELNLGLPSPRPAH